MSSPATTSTVNLLCEDLLIYKSRPDNPAARPTICPSHAAPSMSDTNLNSGVWIRKEARCAGCRGYCRLVLCFQCLALVGSDVMERT